MQDHDRPGCFDVADAGDAAEVITGFSPTAAEGLGPAVVRWVVARTHGASAVPPLSGDAGCSSSWSATTRARCRTAPTGCPRRRALEGYLVEGPIQAAALSIREDGAGLAGVKLPGPGLRGWEDAAVPPAKLARTCATSTP